MFLHPQSILIIYVRSAGFSVSEIALDFNVVERIDSSTMQGLPHPEPWPTNNCQCLT